MRNIILAFCWDCLQEVGPGSKDLSFLLRLSAKSWFWGSGSKLFAETASYKLVLRSRILAFCWDSVPLQNHPTRHKKTYFAWRNSLTSPVKASPLGGRCALHIHNVRTTSYTTSLHNVLDCQRKVGSEKQNLSFLLRLSAKSWFWEAGS